MSGMRLGSEPNWMLSAILKEGSRVFKLCKTFCTPIFFNSDPSKVAADPVKLSFLRWYIPVTTTSFMAFEAGAITTFLKLSVWDASNSRSNFS